MYDCKNWTYYNYPTPIHASNYYFEINKYIEVASTHEDVLAIYSMGTMKCPGISDIDLIVVTKDNVKNIKNLSIIGNNYDSNLFLHDPIIVSDHVFKYLQYIFYASNLKCLWTHPGHTEPEVFNVPERERAISLLFDFVESRLFEFQLLSKTRHLNVRHWLTRIESFRHSVNLATKFIGDDCRSKYQEVLDGLSELRHIWIKKTRFEINLFNELLVKTANAFAEILLDCSNIPELKVSCPPFNGRIIIDNKIIMFANDKHYGAHFKEISIPFRNKRLYSVVELPHCYTLHLAGYCRNGIVGRQLDVLQKVKEDLPRDMYRNFQLKRINAIQKHKEFLEKNRVNFSMRGYICFDPKIHLNLKAKLFDYIMIRVLFPFKNTADLNYKY